MRLVPKKLFHGNILSSYGYMGLEMKEKVKEVAMQVILYCDLIVINLVVHVGQCVIFFLHPWPSRKVHLVSFFPHLLQYLDLLTECSLCFEASIMNR